MIFKKSATLISVQFLVLASSKWKCQVSEESVFEGLAMLISLLQDMILERAHMAEQYDFSPS